MSFRRTRRPKMTRHRKTTAIRTTDNAAPSAQLFKGDFQSKLSALDVKYSTVPRENYKAYINTTNALRSEPRRQTQKMYAALDPAMQAVLTSGSADPKALLDQAAQQFQQVLDSSAA